MLAASVNFLGFAAQPKTVSIKVDGQTINLKTRALTVQVPWKKPVSFFRKPTDMNWSAMKNSATEPPSKWYGPCL